MKGGKWERKDIDIKRQRKTEERERERNKEREGVCRIEKKKDNVNMW